MKLVNLIKSEFLKNYSIKKIIIIFIVSLISVIGVVEVRNYSNPISDDASRNINYINYRNDELKEIEYPTLRDEYEIFYNDIYLEFYNYVVDNNIITFVSRYGWREYVLEQIVYKVKDNYIIDLIRNKDKDERVINACKTFSENEIEEDIYTFCNYFDDEELNQIYDANNKEINNLKKVFLEDKYYVFLNYQRAKGLNFVDKKFEDIFVKEKISDELDFRSSNYELYMNCDYVISETLLTRNEFESQKDFGLIYPSYEYYLKFYKNLKIEASKLQDILYYSSLNNIESDINLSYIFANNNLTILNTKTEVNQIFHLAVVVMLLVAITGGGIVSLEHSRKTIKNILVAPAKRWKILLSKFIYLILHMYIIWFIILILLCIYSGIRYGFGNLFTPKLIYIGSGVVEINYFLYLLGQMFIASIPIICFISILFFLSTFTLSTTVTVGIMTILSILSPFLWFILPKFKLLSYTPFLYFDLGFFFNQETSYYNILQVMDFNLWIGIIISLVITLILYLITNVIYIKKDIKN